MAEPACTGSEWESRQGHLSAVYKHLPPCVSRERTAKVHEILYKRRSSQDVSPIRAYAGTMADQRLGE